MAIKHAGEQEPTVAPVGGATVQPTETVNMQNQNYTEGQAPSYNFNINNQPQRDPYRDEVQIGGGLLNSLNSFDVPYNMASGKVQAFLDSFKETAKLIPRLEHTKATWDFLVFEGNTYGITASAVLFVRRSGNYAAIYPFIVQDSMEPFPDRMFQTYTPGFGQSQVLVPQLPEEMLTSEEGGVLAKRIEDYVMATYSSTHSKVTECAVIGGRVLPHELEPTNKNQIFYLIFYANEAVESLLYKFNTGKEKSMSLLSKSQNENLTLKFDFNAGRQATGVGLPVRSDLSIKLFVQQNNNRNQQNAIGTNNVAAFSSVSGYMSLMYTGQTPINPMMMNPMMYGQYGMLNPTLQPVFVISRVENKFDTVSLSTQLLALASASVLTFNNMWHNCFALNYSIQEPMADPKDIGLITLDPDVNYPADLQAGEIPAYTNLKTQGSNLNAFLMKYLHQNLIFQFDVPELGDLTHIQRAFLDASGSGKPDMVKQANDAIIEAGNMLTGGLLSTKYPGGEPVVFSEVGRIEQGYYPNERGEMCDLAEIDYLMLLQSVGKEVAQDYQNSFNPAYGDYISRFAKRKAIYDTYFSGYKITGYARRLTLNSAFLIALGHAVQEVGGLFSIEQQYHTNQTVDRAYHNQVIGIPMNGVPGFIQGGYYTANQPQQANVWRTYTPTGTPLYGAPVGGYR